jgi:hypothetical protein
MRCVNASFENN